MTSMQRAIAGRVRREVDRTAVILIVTKEGGLERGLYVASRLPYRERLFISAPGGAVLRICRAVAMR